MFQSHGREDRILPFEGGRALAHLLEEAGLAVRFVPFDGDHEIPFEALEGFVRFLEDHLGATETEGFPRT